MALYTGLVVLTTVHTSVQGWCMFPQDCTKLLLKNSVYYLVKSPKIFLYNYNFQDTFSKQILWKKYSVPHLAHTTLKRVISGKFIRLSRFLLTYVSTNSLAKFILETDRDDITLSRIISSFYIFLSLFLFTAWIANNGMKIFQSSVKLEDGKPVKNKFLAEY